MKTKTLRNLCLFLLVGIASTFFLPSSAQAMNPTWTVTCYRTARYTKAPYRLGKVGKFPVSACSYQEAISKSNRLGVKYKDRYGCYSAVMTGCGQCGSKRICP